MKIKIDQKVVSVLILNKAYLEYLDGIAIGNYTIKK